MVTAGHIGGSRRAAPSLAEMRPSGRAVGDVSTAFPDRLKSPLDANGIWEVLVTVPDPEIPVISIVDLGIVREVAPDRVVLTPTYTGCPAAFAIETMVRTALDEAGFAGVRIETALSPPWTTDWISAEGRRRLHAHGIAPPLSAHGSAVECPRCGASDTEEVSRFGATPCKALWRCRACAEPFDHFKCH